MAGYYDYTYGAKNMQDPEAGFSQAYGNSSKMKQVAPQEESKSGMDAQSTGQAAASGAAMGGPAGAGVAVAGQFLSSYLAQKAQDERSRRDRAAQIEQNYVQNQNQGFDTMQQAYKGALR